MIKILKSRESGFDRQLTETLAFEENSASAVEVVVDEILAQVRMHGDSALIELTNKYDKTALSSIDDVTVHSSDLDSFVETVDDDVIKKLTEAAARIENYHQRQVQSSWSFTDELGNRLGQKVSALARVGLYVPGGKAAYPSSVLMNAIPARVAGVKEVVMVAPAPNGVLNPVVLAAAQIAGVDRVYKVGGAQAIAALAYGTQTIDKVDKIVGPGNAYVAREEKKFLVRLVSI